MRCPVAMAVVAVLLAAGGCAHIPRSAHASARFADYFATPRELAPAFARALEHGHAIEGMDPEQVWVVFGGPISKTCFPGPRALEVWLYPGHKFHQDALRGHGVTLFRVVFIDGRVALIETL